MPQPTTHTFDLTALLTGPYYCTGCAGRVCEAVLAVPGVLEAGCDLESGTLTVAFDAELVTVAELQPLIERLALEAEGRVMHAAYRVAGLD